MDQISHKHIENRKKYARDAQEKPPGFNNWLAVKITNLVGTMWCAYAFTILALISLPDALKAGTSQLIS
ncbi:MAG: hypothetical protein NVS3B5_05410 [Sphingomicrobium sp.]